MKSVKKIGLLFIPMCLLLSSCGSDVSPVTSQQEVSAEELVVQDYAEEETSVDLLSLLSLDEIMEKYVDYLEHIFEDDDKSLLKYYLAYINDDQIPELIYINSDTHASGVHVCVCDKDARVYEAGEFGEYGRFAYLPGTGRIKSYYMNNGCYFTDFYRLEGFSVKDIAYFEIDDASIGSDEVRYYVDGDEVDQKSYMDKYKLMRPDDYIELNYEAAFSYEDTDDVLAVMREYANTGVWPSIVDAKESLEILSGEWAISDILFGNQPEYSKAESVNTEASLSIGNQGNVSVKFRFNEIEVEDGDMVISYAKTDIGDENYACVAFANRENTRKYYVFTGKDDTITVLVNDYSQLFDFDYYNAIFVREEEEE